MISTPACIESCLLEEEKFLSSKTFLYCVLFFVIKFQLKPWKIINMLKLK